MKKLTHITVFWLVSMVAAQAQIAWSGAAGDGKWSSTGNWTGDNVPDTNAEIAQYSGGADVTIDVDANFTINRFVDGFAGEGYTTSLGGTGILTIDVNSSATTNNGVDNATGNSGGTLLFGGNVTINNSGQDAPSDVTIIRNTNSANNILRFAPGSVLTLQTIARTNAAGAAAGSLIEFNGTLAASAADLQIGSNNVSFGTGHDSTGFGRDIVLLGNSKLAVNGGSVLNTGRKFQVNGAAELELNAANAINGANVVVGGVNSLLIDVNANQENMGSIVLNNGTLTIDVDAAVTNLSFASTYGRTWGTGTITINGFMEGTIRFGTDGSGLSRAQLTAINGGIYSLTADGYLTTQSIEHWARYQIGAEGYVLMSPWIDRYAYVAAAPYLWIVDAGWVYMEEAVGINGYGWVYAYNLAGLVIYRTDDSGFGYSFALNRWVYSPAEVAGAPAGWFYVL